MGRAQAGEERGLYARQGEIARYFTSWPTGAKVSGGGSLPCGPDV